MKEYAFLETAILAIFFIIIFVIINQKIDDFYNKKFWKKPLKNFPLRYKGKTIWFSRAVATTLLAFGYDKNQRLHVLANKRGKGCPDFQGYWNVICGYLEFNHTGEQNCKKECEEETGLLINEDDIHFLGVTTSPKENKQNVSLRYYTILPKSIEEYNFDLSKMEKDEVDDVKFIPIDEIDNYDWAFNHLNLIKNNLPKKS